MTGVEGLLIGFGVGFLLGALRSELREVAAIDHMPTQEHISPGAAAVGIAGAAVIYALSKVDGYNRGYREGYRRARRDFAKRYRVRSRSERNPARRPAPKV